MSLAIEIIDDPAGLPPLTDEWNGLASRFLFPIVRHDWFSACTAAFCPPGRLNVIVGREEDRVVAIAPLVLNRRYGIRRLELLGASVLGEPSGVLYRDNNVLDEFLDAIFSQRRPIYFRGLPADSALVQRLRQMPSSMWTSVRWGEFASPWIPITSDWKTFLSSISSSWRSTLRRAQRRAEEFGAVALDVVPASSETLCSLTEELFRVEAAGWKARVGTALQTYAELNKFFNVYSRSATERGVLRFAFLRINGQAIASQLFVESDNRLWVLKVGYDEAYARCSPGILLTHKMIQYAFEKRFASYEFLGARDPWTEIWKPQLHKHAIYRRYHRSPLPMISQIIESSLALWSRVLTLKKKQGKGIPWRLILKKAGERLHRSESSLLP